MGVELPGDDFIGGDGDEVADGLGHFAEVRIHERTGLFQHAEGADERAGHDVAPDGKVFQGTLGLGPPISRGSDFDGAHGIGFGAGAHWGMMKDEG